MGPKYFSKTPPFRWSFGFGFVLFKGFLYSYLREGGVDVRSFGGGAFKIFLPGGGIDLPRRASLWMESAPELAASMTSSRVESHVPDAAHAGGSKRKQPNRWSPRRSLFRLVEMVLRTSGDLSSL